MQVTVEDVNSVKKILHVEVPVETVSQEIENAYREIKKKAKIKGFRPGKVPRNVIERLFKKDVHADVTNRLIQDTFAKAIREADLNIVGRPQIDPSEISVQSPFQYHATVEISPKIDAIDFKGLKLKKTVYETSDAEVETQLKLLQKNMAQLKTITEDRPVETDDFVLVDYEGTKDGKMFPDIGKADNFAMQIGKKTIAPEIDEQLLGMKAGDEKSIAVRFPEDHFNKAMADQQIDFKVHLKEIREEILPEIDDELAKDLGDYENLEALKAKIVENLKKGYDKRADQELNEQIFQILIEKTPFDVPDALVEAELEGILSDVERSFQYRNQSLEDVGLSREKLAVQYRTTAEKQVRRFLILDKIIEQESLALSDEEMDAEMNRMAEALKQPVDEIRRYYGENPNRLEFFKHGLLEKKAMDLILEQSRIEKVRREDFAAPEDKTEETKKE